MSSFISGQCAFCGENFSNMPIAYGAPSEEDRGTCTKLKPLRWQFLTNKSPCTKFMCTACVDKRRGPQQAESSHDVRGSDKVHVRKLQQQEGRDFNQQKPSTQVMRFEHLGQQRQIQKIPQIAQEQRVKLCEQQPELRGSRNDICEQLTSDGRRRRSMQTSESPHEAPRRRSLQQPFANRSVPKESMMQSCPTNTTEIEHQSSTGTPTHQRKSSSGQFEPCVSGQQLSSTADILGMTRALELPPNYFERSSSLPKCSSMRLPEQDALDCRQTKSSGPPEARENRRRATTIEPQVEARKQNETEEERQRRKSASYARMLLRMQRHYDALQLNGSQAPATAPPRRIRTMQHAKSVAVRDDKDNPATVAIDLDYLRAYKDAR